MKYYNLIFLCSQQKICYGKLINTTCFIVSGKISVFLRKPSHEQIYLEIQIVNANDVYSFLLFQLLWLCNKLPPIFVHNSIMNSEVQETKETPQEWLLSVPISGFTGSLRAGRGNHLKTCICTCLKPDAGHRLRLQLMLWSKYLQWLLYVLGTSSERGD